MKRKKRTTRFNSKIKKPATKRSDFTLLIKKIALISGILFILGFFALVLSYKPQKKQVVPPVPVPQHSVVKKEIKYVEPIIYQPKPKKELQYPSKSTSRLILKHKSDGDILSIRGKKLRITFKENKLIASQKELFKESQINPNTLYCVLKGVNSKLNGKITEQFKKQSFSDNISIRQRHHQLTLKIHIKASCEYKRSAWAKKSGLDLLTFSCK
jgi:hypothetical protein